MAARSVVPKSVGLSIHRTSPLASETIHPLAAAAMRERRLRKECEAAEAKDRDDRDSGKEERR